MALYSSTLPVTPVEGFLSPFGYIARLAFSLACPALPCPASSRVLTITVCFCGSASNLPPCPVEVQASPSSVVHKTGMMPLRQEDRCRKKWALFYPSPPRRSASLQRVPDLCRPACLPPYMPRVLLNFISHYWDQHGDRITEDADTTA